MTGKRSQLAKLTRPRLHKAVARERLFKLLDEAREHKPAICVVGPPGAGKTTLVASWLDARGIKGIWYQVDPGDADLATFFYYLGEAARPFTRKGQRPLPLLTPEYLHDVEGFSRRFFRELFARLPEGTTLVLDNYQEVGPEQQFHQLVAQAVDEVPAGMTLIAVSRRDPPDSYAKLIANDNVALVDWNDLKLTLEEAAALSSARHEVGSQEVARLHELSGGWAAGLVLLLERLRRGTHDLDIASPNSLREVFDYFAAQLVEQFDTATQKALMKISYLPRTTAATAIALTGTRSAGALLEDLHRRHLFTDRRMAQEPVNQLHALFQAFLQHRATRMLDRKEQSRCAMHAARLLEESGNLEDAFPLALRGGDIAAAVAIVLKHAALLIGQGRWRTVADWIGALPHEMVASDCWLLHWHGTALTSVEPAKARALLEASFNVAESVDDVRCQIQAAAGVIQTYMLEYKRFQPLDRWIDVLKKFLGGTASFSSVDEELKARSALLVALSFRKPDDALLEDCAERVLALVESGADATLRALSVAYLAYCARTGPVKIAERALPLLQKLVAQPGLSALTLGWGWWAIAYVHLVCGNASACREAVSRADQIGKEEGLAPASRFAAAIGAHIEMDTGNIEAAEAWSRRLDELITPALPYDRALSNTIKALLAVIKGDPGYARALCQEAVELFDEAGVYQLRCLTRTQLAWPTMMQGDFEEAEHLAQEALQLALATHAEWVQLDARAALTAISLERNDRSIVRDRLQAAFVLLDKTRYVPTLSKYRAWAARLCGEALKLDVESSNVRSLVHQLGLRAPSIDLEAWPWPVRVYTLGQFRVLVDDKPLIFWHKTPKKPIALLKALIALGGRGIALDQIVDAVWLDEEGDSAHDACELALHRLRKLLGGPETVQLVDNRLSLDPELVWTDVAAFEQALSAQDAHTPEDNAIGRALSFYQGDFLPGETNAPWAAPTRERLRGKFVHQVERQGQCLEEVERWDEAITLYLRGIDADPLAETFYQGLMRCHKAQGKVAEALSAYRRLKQILSITLGITPSPVTETMARGLRASQ